LGKLGPVSAAVLTWVLAFTILALYFNLTQHGWIAWYRLHSDGRTTAATITQLNPTNHNGCRYAYSVASRSYTHSEEGCADDHLLGDVISVTYSPSDPAFATVDDPLDRLRTALIVNLLVPTAAAIGIAGIVLQSRRKRG